MYGRIVTGLAVGLAALLTAFHLSACTASSGGDRVGTWQILSEATSSHATAFNSLVFFDGSHGFGLTALGLESTSDGGMNWTLRLENGGTRGFYTMWFSDEQTGWILGTERLKAMPGASSRMQSAKPLMLKTNDGGTTWQSVNLNALSSFDGASFTLFSSMCFEPAGKAWIVGDAGIVEAMIDSDTLRTISFTASSRPLNAVACDNARQVWAVGDGGLIMRHREQQWHSTVYGDGVAYFTRVKLVGSDVWLTGGIASKGKIANRGLLVFSRNGDDWEDRTPSASETLYDLGFEGNEGWAVGAGGGIFHTTNGGSAWAKEMSPTSNDLLAIFLYKGRGWISGDKLIVLGLKQPHGESVQ